MNRRLFYLSSSVIATGVYVRDLAGNVVDSNRLLSSVLDSYNGVVRQSIGFLNRWYNAEWQVLSAFATLLPISFSEEQPKEGGREPSTPSSSSVVELTGDDFARAMMRSDKDMLVVFYAPWCGYCRRLFPIWESLASSLTGKSGVVIAQIDATKHNVHASGVSVQGYPTIYLFKKGRRGWPIEYRGGRDVASFVDFLRVHVVE